MSVYRDKPIRETWQKKPMKAAKALTIFAYTWSTLVLLLNLVGMFGLGLRKTLEVYSPFNLNNWILNVVLLLPAVAALYWSERLKAKR